MQIILKCRDEHGSVAFSVEQIEGLPAPERRYEIVDHQVTLSGHADVILHHDAEKLLEIPIFRMLTSAEQDALAEAERAASSVQENAPAPEQESEQENDAGQGQSTDSAPAKKSKSSGG